MHKLFATTAILSLLATNAALADPAAMLGMSVNFGGAQLSPGITAKVLSSDKQDEAVAAAGVSYFPWEVSKFGLDLSAGYNFNESTALIGYDLLNQKFQASGGWVNTAEQESEFRTPSDRRFKRNVRTVGTTASGIKLYAYRYIWSDTFFVGVMAQDLLASPQWAGAVVENANGYFSVNYAMLGLRMITLDEWETQGMAAVLSADSPFHNHAMMLVN